MEALLPTLFLTIVLMGIMIAGIGVRNLLVKDGEFRGTCAQNNPMLKSEIGECTVCGRMPGEDCKSDEVQLNPKIQ